MNKYQEALEKYGDIIVSDREFCGETEYICFNETSEYKTLQELADRATPMKVEQTYLQEDKRIYDCPKCKETWYYTNEREEWKYCPNCGQKLYWEE